MHILPLLFLTACSVQQSTVDPDVSSMASSLSSAIASSQGSSAFSASNGYNGPFKYTSEEGHIGTITVQGYAFIQEQKEDPDYDLCGENCGSYEYVFFRLTDPLTEPLSSFVKGNRGNSFMKENAIGLGCLSDGVISASSPDFPSEISREMTERLLQATENDPITLTLVRTVEPLGMGAPRCYAHFRFVSVAR